MARTGKSGPFSGASQGSLINGKPKDLGVFDVSDEKFIIKMNNTQKADAFAITIEQKGGSQSPTLEKMESLGKTKATQ